MYPTLKDVGWSVILIALLWGVLWALRPSHVVEGTISFTHHRTYPWQLGERFDLRVQTATGRMRWFKALQGHCEGPRRLFAKCAVPALPVGAPIKLVVFGFTDPNTCTPPLEVTELDWRCLGHLDRIGSIEVAGQKVGGGWANAPASALLYAVVAAGVFILAFNRWRIRRVSFRAAAIYAVVAATCVLSGDLY